MVGYGERGQDGTGALRCLHCSKEAYGERGQDGRGTLRLWPVLNVSKVEGTAARDEATSGAEWS